MDDLYVPVIYGSVRRERVGIRAARFVTAQLLRRGVQAELIDPLEHPLPLLDLMYKEYERGSAPPVMEGLAKRFASADGFLIVSGEYNHGIPPALKNMLDHFLEEFFWRPAGIVCYSGGRFGGVRAAMQLRMTLAELGMITIPSLLPVPQVQNAFDEAGVPTEARTEAASASFFEEFLWYVHALRAQRDKGVPQTE